MTALKSAHLFNDDYQFLLEMFSSDEVKQATQFFDDLHQNPTADKKQQGFALLDQMMTSLAGGEPISADKHLVAPATGTQKAVDLYVFYPDNHQNERLPVVYFAHGGGLIVGNANQQNAALKALANANKVAVVSLEYTLVPVAPHPADMLDAYHGLAYLFENAEHLNFDKHNLIIMGESGGGTVASRLALYNAEQGKYTPKGLVLIYPMLDYRTGSDDDIYRNEFAGELVWTRATNQLGWTTSQGGQDLASDKMRFFSPALVADVSGLPPTFMAVGSLDLFVNENIDFANKLIRQGVPTEFHILNGVPHAFESFNPDSALAQEFFRLRNNAIQKMIGG
ncbi:alpha/beta hydrolase [Actinobacillus capsulatus]|uniref:alpha/beta hydrolase n=1 Tax=Actinobacillus capsulatus TaxID=717 RepID=UPI000372A4FF|nr:alpha/beta hydrolase [Actinobacillus capsulatus]